MVSWFRVTVRAETYAGSFTEILRLRGFSESNFVDSRPGLSPWLNLSNDLAAGTGVRFSIQDPEESSFIGLI
jgi:hypothetical protein